MRGCPPEGVAGLSNLWGYPPEGIVDHVTEGFPPWETFCHVKYKYQGRERHKEIEDTEIGRVNTLVKGNSLCIAMWRVICILI